MHRVGNVKGIGIPRRMCPRKFSWVPAKGISPMTSDSNEVMILKRVPREGREWGQARRTYYHLAGSQESLVLCGRPS